MTKFNSNNEKLTLPNLGKWIIYYYVVWFDERPNNILNELEDFAKGKDPYDPDTAEQFNDDPLKYWSYMSGGANKELHKVATRVFSITVTTAAVERLFSNMGHLHSDRRNRLDHNKVLSMGQIRNDMNYRRKKTEIDESRKKFHSENYAAPVEESEIQEIGPIGSIERIKRTRHPAINRQKGKWEIEEIFEYNLDDPSFYQEL
nr:10636_t:CDS:2 [Entrophospora candida]CAG8652393.1 12252_t:CDS:2 [Entrophospora candida]